MPTVVECWPKNIQHRLDEIQRLAKLSTVKPQLRLLQILPDDLLNVLQQFINSGKTNLPFAKLFLPVDLATLQKTQFISLLKSFNDSDITAVKLIFTSDDIVANDNKITQVLNYLAVDISYPLQIYQDTGQEIVLSQMDLTNFKKIVIENIQRRRHVHEDIATVETNIAGNIVDDPAINDHRSFKKIIRNSSRSGNNFCFDSTLLVDRSVDYVIDDNQSHQQDQTVHEALENTCAMQQDLASQALAIQSYDGSLLGFAEFSSPQYRNKVSEYIDDDRIITSLYALLQQELFANLPHAIKFISPAAADQLAANLPSFVALNKDNLPDGFVLKKTQDDELVLDFAEHEENQQRNAFTPVAAIIDSESLYVLDWNWFHMIYVPVFRLCDRIEMLDFFDFFYQTQAKADDELIDSEDDRWCSADKHGIKWLPIKKWPAINLWIKYGTEGLAAFFRQLTTAAGGHKSRWWLDLRVLWLYCLPQWDHLYGDQEFFHHIQLVKQYETAKYTCLVNFLRKTGSSRHNLTATIKAFEYFWGEWQQICAHNNHLVSDINIVFWETPNGGNPVVYMERLLCILKNARSLTDQLRLLRNETQPLVLDNYGAYYASCFEGFTAVAPVLMQLQYNAEEHNASKVYSQWLYRCELSMVVDYYIKKISSTQHQSTTKTLLQWAKLMYRFIGWQTHGITVYNWHVNFLLNMQKKFRINLSTAHTISGVKEELSMLLMQLFFVIHDRYTEQHNEYLTHDYNTFSRCSRRETFDSVIKNLYKLYCANLKFNGMEGQMLCTDIGLMNTREFEGYSISKESSIDTLFTWLLVNNRYTTLQFYAERFTLSTRFPVIFALDTAAFFAQDVSVASVYGADLLFFALYSSIVYCDDQHVISSAETSRQLIKENKNKYLEPVLYYLRLSASGGMVADNLLYAIRLIIKAKYFFEIEHFISACEEIGSLNNSNAESITQILIRHKLPYIPRSSPKMFTNNVDYLRDSLIDIIRCVTGVPSETVAQPEAEGIDFSTLGAKDINTLYAILNRLISTLPIVQVQQKWLAEIFQRSINNAIAVEFAGNSDIAQTQLCTVVGRVVAQISLPQITAMTVESFPGTITSIQAIAKLLPKIMTNSWVISQVAEFTAVFNNFLSSKIQIQLDTFADLLQLLAKMPQVNYLSLLQAIGVECGRFMHFTSAANGLFSRLTDLQQQNLPINYLAAFSQLIIAECLSASGEQNNATSLLARFDQQKLDVDIVHDYIIAIYAIAPDDPRLKFIFANKLSLNQVVRVIQILRSCEPINSSNLAYFLTVLWQQHALDDFLLLTQHRADICTVMNIIVNSCALSRNSAQVKYLSLLKLVLALQYNDLAKLAEFYQTAVIDAAALHDALDACQNNLENFAAFLLWLEKHPFGKRDLATQFSITEVERVIHESMDLLNYNAQGTTTIRSHNYRLQLMRLFMIVNALGQELPVYCYKPAKDLSNAEIKACFQQLKTPQCAGIELLQRQLLALSLMREAMYRSNKQFPYSTQIIAVIDGMMNPSRYIASINTGQGKSLIDSMKAALCWLDNTCVYFTTSALVDAKRDIANYGRFFALLGIAYAKEPISASSSFDAVEQNGINYTTVAQLSLLRARATICGKQLNDDQAKIALIVNESDYAILDDQVIYRLAMTDKSGISASCEWLYYAINEFVMTRNFIYKDQAIAQDILDLTQYLQNYARYHKKPAKIIQALSDKRYLALLKSACIAQYILKENYDYVITDDPRLSNGDSYTQAAKVVKVLMKDGRVSNDTTFANGVHQLLCAHLNYTQPNTYFDIKPYTKTIIATNNKNFFDYYLARGSQIMGSSGTVGNKAECQEQYRKYAFVFSQLPPHQPSQVKVHKKILVDSQDQQFDKLVKLLPAKNQDNKSPHLIFCQDINAAQACYERLFAAQLNPATRLIQLYTGIEQEEEIIRQAATPGMITVTTQALGRNTDIDHRVGLQVWHTSVDISRRMLQRNGRTGRQGSPGDVHYVLLKSDLSKDLSAELESQSRQANEFRHNILGCLQQKLETCLPQVDMHDSAREKFWGDIWADFSANTEQHLKAMQDKERCLAKIIAEFNEIIGQNFAGLNHPLIELPELQQLIGQDQQNMYPQYKPQDTKVLNNCTIPMVVPVVMCNELPANVAPAHDVGVVDETETIDIGAALSTLFAVINKHSANQMQCLSARVNYTIQLLKIIKQQTQNNNRAQVVNDHDRFLQQYLAFSADNKLNIGKLQQFISEPNCLAALHDMASIDDQPVVSTALIKKVVSTLLADYLATSWFINVERRQWAEALLEQVSTAADIPALLQLLGNEQIKVARNDSQTNQQRRIKPLHLFGCSRYQQTLNQALSFAAACVKEEQQTTAVAGNLLELLSTLTNYPDLASATLTTDQLHWCAKAKANDSGNAKVIISILHNILAIKERQWVGKNYQQRH